MIIHYVFAGLNEVELLHNKLRSGVCQYLHKMGIETHTQVTQHFLFVRRWIYAIAED